MSTYDRMKQVKDLLANPSGLHLKSNISLNSIARLLNDSKSKVNQLLISQNQSSSKAIVAVDKSLDLTSMKNLANYVLYDDVEPIAAASCLFDLSDLDQNQVKYFAGEIDAIESELIDMSAQIKSLQSAYKTYYEDFLSLCDRKDELFELFLDYYEEYILNVNNTDESNKLAVKSAAPNKTTKVRLKVTNLILYDVYLALIFNTNYTKRVIGVIASQMAEVRRLKIIIINKLPKIKRM